jgi:predicted alpha/beta-fold hydrolase
MPDDIPVFDPPRLLKPAMAQTMLAGLSLRKRGSSIMEETACFQMLECGDGIRTTARISTHPQGRGTVILLHGWLGHVDSTYVISTARFLYDQGWSVIRINLLDHGDALTLNPGVFNATHFAEMFTALRQAVDLAPHGPCHLIGFSLGGNFALRVARAMRQDPIDGLARIFAISPVIDPAEAGRMIDANPLIRRYFRRKLEHTFRTKQAAFPELGQMEDVMAHATITDITDAYLKRWSSFPDTDSYFNAYAIGRDDLQGCPVPVTAICAADDPIVPGLALNTLSRDPGTEIIVTRHGGHNGFFQSLTGPTYYDTLIHQRLTV